MVLFIYTFVRSLIEEPIYMARKEYPFSKRDMDYGTKLLSSLITAPIAAGISTLKTSGHSTNEYQPPKPYVYEPKGNKIGIWILGILAMACPFAGVLTYAFAFWNMMLSYILFSVVEAIICAYFLTIEEKITTLFIFNKETLQAQLAGCKYLTKFGICLSILLFVLNLYPVICLLVHHNSWFAWDGGEVPDINFLIILLFQLYRGFVIKATCSAKKNLGMLVEKNPSYKIIKKKERGN